MATADHPHDDRYQTQAWMDYVLGCMHQGATLTWGPTTGYVLTAANGEWERVRWYVGAALRNSRAIVADTTELYAAKTYRLADAPKRQQATADRRTWGRH